ncbi:MAG TPA: YtxH domain-containing protein [Gemmatimonadaceae bacterium]|nr:YtxH domain-containing protein [Gemmatimonadaceae bacterium]
MTDHMRNDDRQIVIEKSSSGVAPFLIGLAIGAGAALLFAPQSGEQTRRDIARRGRRIKLRAREAAEDLRDKAEETYQDARAGLEDTIDSAREAVGRGKRQVSRAVGTGRAAAHQAREDLERRLAASKAAYQAGVESSNADGEE